MLYQVELFEIKKKKQNPGTRLRAFRHIHYSVFGTYVNAPENSIFSLWFIQKGSEFNRF